MKHTLILLLSILTCCACIREDTYSDSPRGNFEALWKILDEHYCFFDYKQKEYGLDWQEVRSRYSQLLTTDMSKEQLFEVLGRMTRELRDGHVNLSSSFNMARYWDWFEQYPANFSDSLQRNYIGTDYRLTQGIRYKILPTGIGYIYVPSFDYAFGDGNLSDIFAHLAICSGIIVDVRNNEGGMITSAQALAECFINEKTIGGYISHKTGPGHNDFSRPQSIELTPAEGVRWQKPVIVLTNRKTFSAANTFAMFMQACPRATLMGARTGGGAGMPFNSELPNGWLVRFSACPMYDKDMHITEHGIDPDICVDITAADWQNGKDTIIETAIRLLQAQQ